MKKVTKILALLLALAMLFTLAACSKKDDSTAKDSDTSSDTPATEEKPEEKTEEKADEKADDTAEEPAASEEKDEYTVVMIPKSLDNVVFNDLRDAAIEHGKELGINVEWNGPTTSDAAEQVNIIENCIERGVDAIAVSVVDAEAVVDAFKRAKEAGIIVCCFDSDAAQSERDFFVGTNNYELGKLCGEEMVKMLPDGGHVAIMIATPGMVNIQERADGFTEVVEANNITVDVVLDCNTDTAIAVDKTNQYCAAHPDLDGFYFTHGLTHYADAASLAEYVEWGKNGGVSIAVDAVYPMYSFFQQGMAAFELVDQDWVEMGNTTIDIIYKMIKGEDPGLPEDKIVNTGMTIIDESNWEERFSKLEPW